MSELNAANSAKAQNIRKQYIDRKEDKMEQLRRLDSKVKTPGRITASFLAVIGALTMGAGMSLVMVWQNMTYGLALSIPGLVVVLLAFPAYRLITGSRKKKYAGAIINLSDSLMNQSFES